LPISVYSFFIFPSHHASEPPEPDWVLVLWAFFARLGDVREGYWCVEIAQALTNRLGSKEVEGEAAAVGVQLQCFINLVQSVVDCHTQGREAAMANRDIRGALMNGMVPGVTNFAAGTKLLGVRQKQG